MGDLLHFPIGGGANLIRAYWFRTECGEPVEILSLTHRHGAAIVWRTGVVVDSRARRGVA